MLTKMSLCKKSVLVNQDVFVVEACPSRPKCPCVGIKQDVLMVETRSGQPRCPCVGVYQDVCVVAACLGQPAKTSLYRRQL